MNDDNKHAGPLVNHRVNIDRLEAPLIRRQGSDCRAVRLTWQNP